MQDTFNSGYTKALVDVYNFFEEHSDVLTRWRLYQKKYVMQFLKLFLQEREKLRETGTLNLYVNRKNGVVGVVKEAKIGESDVNVEEI